MNYVFLSCNWSNLVLQMGKLNFSSKRLKMLPFNMFNVLLFILPIVNKSDEKSKRNWLIHKSINQSKSDMSSFSAPRSSIVVGKLLKTHQRAIICHYHEHTHTAVYFGSIPHRPAATRSPNVYWFAAENSPQQTTESLFLHDVVMFDEKIFFFFFVVH